MSRFAGSIAIIAIVLAGCTQSTLTTGERPPKPCAAVYPVARCEAMTDLVAADIDKNRDDVDSISIIPDAPPGGTHLSAGWHIKVRLALKDGTIFTKEICGGAPEGACADQTRIEAWSPLGGYVDLACGTVEAEDPSDCATPLPTIDPRVAAVATPISIASMSIPITKLGKHEVVLGDGSVPNGQLTRASFQFAEAWPEDVALRDGIGQLEVRSLEPDGKPFDDHYLHGWRPGVERVHAVLVFDVLWFKPGATLEIRNVEVR